MGGLAKFLPDGGTPVPSGKKPWTHMARPRKFKGGICCDGHLAVTYGGVLLNHKIFLVKPAKNCRCLSHVDLLIITNILFVTGLCKHVFTAHTRAHSSQTFKIWRTPLCLRFRITLPAIIGYRTLNKTVTIMCAHCPELLHHIRRYNNSPSYMMVNMATAPQR